MQIQTEHLKIHLFEGFKKHNLERAPSMSGDPLKNVVKGLDRQTTKLVLNTLGN